MQTVLLSVADHHLPVDGASACDLSASVRSAVTSLSSQASYAPPTGLTPCTRPLLREFFRFLFERTFG